MIKKINWDALGVSASVACAIHCALLPLVLSSLPLFGIDIINNNGFEFFMIGLAFCIGAFSLYHGWKKHHRNVLPLFIFSAGMLFLFAKQIWHAYHLWLLFPAVTLIVSAHYFNYRFSKRVVGKSNKVCDVPHRHIKPVSPAKLKKPVANEIEYSEN